MGLIHHEPAPIFPLERDQLIKRGNVAIHRIQALDDHKGVAELGAVLDQQGFKGSHVVVRKTATCGA